MRNATTAACLLLVAIARPAAAEWHIAPTIGVTFSGNTSLVDPELATAKRHKNVGGSVSLLGRGIMGVEAVAVLTPGFFETGTLETVKSSRTFTLVGNAVLTTPRKWTEYSLRPFVSGGLGVLRVSKTEEPDVFSFRKNLAAFNIGGGAVGFFTTRTGVRFDLRYYSTLNRSNQGAVSIGPVHLNYMSASVGVVFRR